MSTTSGGNNNDSTLLLSFCHFCGAPVVRSTVGQNFYSVTSRVRAKTA